MSSVFQVDSKGKNGYNCRMMRFGNDKVILVKGKRGKISLSVPRAGEIRVTADPALSGEAILAFLCRHERFILRRMAQKREEETRFSRVLSYRKALVGGREYDLCIDASVRSGVRDNTVFAREEAAVPHVIERRCKEEFLQRIELFARRMGVSYGKVSFGRGKSRWGSCGKEGKLFFSRALFMLPSSLCDYVIVHELSHRREMNHSVAFWKVVASILPDWRERREALKQYEFLTDLYGGKGEL